MVSLLCGHSEPFSQTWPTSGMTRRGAAYALPTSAPPTGDTGCSSLPGLLPTPTTADGKGGPGNSGRDGGENLRTVAAGLLPTPMARDAKGAARPDGRTRPDGRPRLESERALPDVVCSLLPTPTARDGKGPNQRHEVGESVGGTTPAGSGAADHGATWGPYAAAVHRWERALGRVAPAPTEPAPRGGQRLAPVFVEWLMGIPSGWVTAVPGITRNEQLKALGNGVVPQQATAAVRRLLAVSAQASGTDLREVA